MAVGRSYVLSVEEESEEVSLSRLSEIEAEPEMAPLFFRHTQYLVQGHVTGLQLNMCDTCYEAVIGPTERML